jgi:hypothetical protein
MRHIREGTLRAYLDGELAPDAYEHVRTHLGRCDHCRGRLAALVGEARWVEEYITSMAPDRLAAPRPQRVLTKIREVQQIGGNETMFAKMTKRQRRALVGVLAAIVIVGSLSLAPVRAWASEFLGIFRAERFVVVNADPERFEELDTLLHETEVIGEIEILQEPTEPQEVASLEEAAATVGFQPRTLTADFLGESRVEVVGQSAVRITPDVEAIRTIFEAMELDPMLIPDSVDGQPFTITVPAGVYQSWEQEGEEEGVPPIELYQLHSPEVDVPNDVDVTALGEAMLQLFGMTPEEAARMSQRVDWTTTLVLPVPDDLVRVQEVDIDGTSGLLFVSGWQEYEGNEYHHRDVTLLWQQNGVVTLVTGPDEQQVVELANSIR